MAHGCSVAWSAPHILPLLPSGDTASSFSSSSQCTKSVLRIPLPSERAVNQTPSLTLSELHARSCLVFKYVVIMVAASRNRGIKSGNPEETPQTEGLSESTLAPCLGSALPLGQRLQKALLGVLDACLFSSSGQTFCDGSDGQISWARPVSL